MSQTATATATEVAAECRGVKKSFGDGANRVEVLHGLDVTVKYGQMTFLIGPSGCGKTTLISLIAGLLDVTDGDLFVLGKELSKMPGRKKTAFRRENVGFVFQQYNLLPSLNAAENAAVPLVIAGVGRREAIDRAKEMLKLVGLGDKLKSYANQLSGGQQQRVAIARALVTEPKLMVCDEPTAALDGKSGQTVLELLKEVACKEGRAVIIVTHDTRIFHFADRTISMLDGTIDAVQDGAMEGH